ncbi:myozenin-2 isoform X3 [Phyllopteryx taeniolatus]|uniref:myozenin-2 isoform X3 n=1 Tax=Phyllopteryx taeniolatus TaxID=161469 RepID=UPI002AD5486D|nr:myozenin-2 isoform X3 [Phyllopteryx taeniolatus]
MGYSFSVWGVSHCCGEASSPGSGYTPQPPISALTPHTDRQKAGHSDLQQQRIAATPETKGMIMFMQSGLDDVTKQRMLQAQMLSKHARGGRLNLGKKVSVPKDVMIEELTLPSNRGSRMFQERQRRAERFTLENAANSAHKAMSAHPVAVPPPQIIQKPQGGKENQAFSNPGKHSLVMNLKKTLAKKGSPDVLAPGYSGPLKEIPHEKFNTTMAPRSYWSPWREALRYNEELLEPLNAQLPLPQKYQLAHYRCFNSSNGLAPFCLRLTWPGLRCFPITTGTNQTSEGLERDQEEGCTLPTTRR